MPPSLRLPAALREQVENELDSTRRRKKFTPSRKEARKQTRQEQKQRKAQFFTRSNPPTPKVVQQPVTDEGPPKKRTRTDSQNSTVNDKKVSSPVTHEKRKRKSNVEISVPASDEDPEDARILWLETKLGMGSSSGKRSALFGDGLDDLLGDLDRLVSRSTTLQKVKSESTVSSESDEQTSDDENASENVDSDFAGFSADVYHNLSANSESIIESNQADPSPQPTTKTETHYIPPHMRNAQNNDNSEKQTKLIRQLKGLLNRLSEPNLFSIINSVEEAYREYPRHDVTSSLTRLIIDGIALHSSHLDTFVVLHATLVGSLYKLVGVDFGAHFVQILNDEYHHHYQSLELSDNADSKGIDVPQGKECLNLVILFSELYNFQIISCVLVYDIIRELLNRLNEVDVELLLKILRNSGQQLRQDDPSALKDIVDIVQTKIDGKDKSMISSRTRFMVETLTNLKNNKLKRSADPNVHTEQIERMKKFLTGLNKKHHVKAHEPLRVNLDDLRSVEKRGKWWIVGAAWSGNPLVEKADEIHQLTSNQTQSDSSLWKLARKQGMNTDVRRSIFIVLMSSEDYIDACERLSQLNLSEVQQREIIRVVLHCLGNEKQYNPFYTLVLQQLTHNSHAFKITLQYCFWDFLRQMGEKEVGGAEILKSLHDNEPDFDVDQTSVYKRLHFARAFAWLVAKDHSSLLILKPVDFTRLKPQTRTFFQDLFFHIFLSSQVSSPAITLDQNATKYLAGSRKQEVLEQVFMKALRVPTLTQGLLYFIGNVLGDFGDHEVLSQVLGWGRDVALNTLHGTLDIDKDR